MDGEALWQHIDLRPEDQREHYRSFLAQYPPLPFPKEKNPGFRYYTENNFFPPFDAYTLSAIIRSRQPKRIVEVGSGFSSAVMLDTTDHLGATLDLTFIEPFPDRLHSLLGDHDRSSVKIMDRPLEEIPTSVFEQLEANDILFIDSSHVAKVGSDVTHLILRILPTLRRGVIIHVHDIFYPESYPIEWIAEGRSWNESIMLRSFLIGNPAFEIIAFNSFASQSFPELFHDYSTTLSIQTGGSFWFHKTA